MFAGADPGTVTIAGTVTPGQINVTSGPYTLSGAILATGGVFNGTAFGATTNARTITDTIGSLTVSAHGNTSNNGLFGWAVGRSLAFRPRRTLQHAPAR